MFSHFGSFVMHDTQQKHISFVFKMFSFEFKIRNASKDLYIGFDRHHQYTIRERRVVTCHCIYDMITITRIGHAAPGATTVAVNTVTVNGKINTDGVT